MSLCTLMSWLPAGYSQIFRLFVFDPSGLKDYGSASLHCKIRSIPFLGLRRGGGHGGTIQGKKGIKFCHLATLVSVGAKDGLFRGKSLLPLQWMWGPHYVVREFPREMMFVLSRSLFRS